MVLRLHPLRTLCGIPFVPWRRRKRAYGPYDGSERRPAEERPGTGYKKKGVFRRWLLTNYRRQLQGKGSSSLEQASKLDPQLQRSRLCRLYRCKTQRWKAVNFYRNVWNGKRTQDWPQKQLFLTPLSPRQSTNWSAWERAQLAAASTQHQQNQHPLATAPVTKATARNRNKTETLSKTENQEMLPTPQGLTRVPIWTSMLLCQR